MTTYIVTFEVNDISRKSSLEDKLQISLISTVFAFLVA